MVPSVTAPLETAIAIVGGVATLLWLLSNVPRAYTALRRSVRNARISQRVEGWGSSDHPNQQLIDPPSPSPPVEAPKESHAS